MVNYIVSYNCCINYLTGRLADANATSRAAVMDCGNILVLKFYFILFLIILNTLSFWGAEVARVRRFALKTLQETLGGAKWATFPGGTLRPRRDICRVQAWCLGSRFEMSALVWLAMSNCLPLASGWACCTFDLVGTSLRWHRGQKKTHF